MTDASLDLTAIESRLDELRSMVPSGWHLDRTDDLRETLGAGDVWLRLYGHAPADLGALLAEVRRLRERVEELNALTLRFGMRRSTGQIEWQPKVVLLPGEAFDSADNEGQFLLIGVTQPDKTDGSHMIEVVVRGDNPMGPIHDQAP